MVEAAATVLKRETRDAATGQADRGKWAERWYDALRPVLGAIMRGAVDREVDKLGPYDPTGYLHEYTSELSRTLAATSYKRFEKVLREAMADGLSVPDTAKLLRERLPELNKGRAELIAVTELHNAAEGVNYRQAELSPAVSRAVWHHSGKAEFRPEHKVLDGTARAIGTPFPTGELFPSRPRCGCFLTFDDVPTTAAERTAPVTPAQAVVQPAEATREPDIPEPPAFDPEPLDAAPEPIGADRAEAVEHMFDERLDADDPFADDDPFAEDYDDEPETDEEREQRLYEERVLKETQYNETSRLLEVILTEGGIRTSDALREEYRAIPNVYKRRDGMAGDDMALVLSDAYPEFGIHSERDLLEFFEDNYGAGTK